MDRTRHSLQNTLKKIRQVPAFSSHGKISESRGKILVATLPGGGLGDVVSIDCANAGEARQLGEIIRFVGNDAYIAPYQSLEGVNAGATVRLLGHPPRVPLGSELLGTIRSARGELLRKFVSNEHELHAAPQAAPQFKARRAEHLLDRPKINERFVSGIRAIDTLTPLGKGQRLAILAEPGVGKSTLLGMLTKAPTCDVNVVAMIGERSREVAEFIDTVLPAESRSKTVVVVSTSDEPAVARIAAANTAAEIAEYFRSCGMSVLLLVDSLSRLCRALRESGLAAGELPVRRGYTASVYAALPTLLERAGTSHSGSITAFYTVLMSSDLDEDPMVEEIKSLTDGHIVLSGELAQSAQYPAIDPLNSISRVAGLVTTEAERKAATQLRRLIVRLKNDKDILAFGGNAELELQQALQFECKIREFLCQDTDQSIALDETNSELQNVLRLDPRYEL
jgi:FliI/YscN family ATPase